MTLGTANLGEQLLAALHLAIVQVAGGRNCQATVPHHELIVLLVAHLLLAVVRLAVEQVLLEGILLVDVLCAEHLVDAVGDASVCAVGIVGVQQAALVGAKLLDIADDLGILALRLRPFGGGVEEVAVRAGHVGDVPDSVGTSTVLQGATRHRVGEALQRSVTATMRAQVVVGCRIVGAGLEGASLLVPHVRVQVDKLRLLLPLCLDVLVVQRIEESRTIDADGRLQAYLIISR